MTENYFNRCISTDFDLCHPVLTRDELLKIMWTTSAKTFELFGTGPNPQIVLDLEQFQVVDYRAFERVTDEQRQYIDRLHFGSPIVTEEMIYLSLQSLYALCWPRPESEDDIRRAATYHQVLNQALMASAFELSFAFSEPGALLPYWGRLAFLRTMSIFPTEDLEKYQINNLVCALIKHPSFNATTVALRGGSLIALNYALEPILKSMNRYVLHYYHTEDMAGPLRLHRAWLGIAPTVLHFSEAPALDRLTNSSAILFDLEMVKLAQALTIDQLDFILMHEIGHVALNHARKLQASSEVRGNVNSTRHEIEFEADEFAFGILWTDQKSDIRHSFRSDNDGEHKHKYLPNATSSHLDRLGAARLLFTYMDFIERSGELLKKRFSSRIRFRAKKNTHPTAKARLERLDSTHNGMGFSANSLQRYAVSFFDRVLSYAQNMEDEELFESVWPRAESN